MSCHRRFYAGWTNQVLLYETGDHTPYPVTHHNQKNVEKKVHTQTTESLCCTAEINTL